MRAVNQALRNKRSMASNKARALSILRQRLPKVPDDSFWYAEVGDKSSVSAMNDGGSK